MDKRWLQERKGKDRIVELYDKLISYETALLAKKLGFNPYFQYEYLRTIDLKYPPHFITDVYRVNEYPDERVGLCSQSILQKWLRDNYNIVLETYSEYDEENNKDILFGTQIRVYRKGKYNSLAVVTLYLTYEESLERGLLEGLEILQKHKKN